MIETNGWEIIEGVRCVACPDCGFVFSASCDTDGQCPNCVVAGRAALRSDSPVREAEDCERCGTDRWVCAICGDRRKWRNRHEPFPCDCGGQSVKPCPDCAPPDAVLLPRPQVGDPNGKEGS